jgi:undecaprenyl-diphosphatase
MGQDVLSLNWNLFEQINGPAGHAGLLDSMMIFTANNLLYLLPLLLLLFWFALARWSPLLRRDSPTDAARMDAHVTLLLTVLGAAIALGFAILLGNMFFEPRPFISHPGVVHKLIAHPADASFPSDHAAVAFASATGFIVAARELARRKIVVGLALFVAFLALLAAIAIAYARVYVGAHYPGDVLGGMLCGIISGLIALALRPLLAPLLTLVIRLLGQVGMA